MKRCILVVFLVYLWCIPCVFADTPKETVKKAVFSDWIKDKTLHWSLIATGSLSGASTGLIESSRYGGYHISNNADDYHAYRLIQDVSNISYGYLIFKQAQQDNKSFWFKSGRIIESLCWRRNALELTYRWNVSGDPFNYSSRYSSNKKAIVYFKWDGERGKFIDAYIGGVGKTGLAIDVGFAGLAALLHLATN